MDQNDPGQCQLERIYAYQHALVEAKERIVSLERKLQAFLICSIVLLVVSLTYGLAQVWQTTTWLQDFGNYVKKYRDPKWESWINEIRVDQRNIKTEIDCQSQLLKNLKVK